MWKLFGNNHSKDNRNSPKKKAVKPLFPRHPVRKSTPSSGSDNKTKEIPFEERISHAKKAIDQRKQEREGIHFKTKEKSEKQPVHIETPELTEKKHDPVMPEKEKNETFQAPETSFAAIQNQTDENKDFIPTPTEKYDHETEQLVRNIINHVNKNQSVKAAYLFSIDFKKFAEIIPFDKDFFPFQFYNYFSQASKSVENFYDSRNDYLIIHLQNDLLLSILTGKENYLMLLMDSDKSNLGYFLTISRKELKNNL